MTGPSVEIDGVEQVQKNLAKLAKKFSQATVDGAVAGAHLIRTDAVKSIQDESGGEIVTRTRAGGGEYEHTASKEGDAPNTDTGRLVQSVQVDVKPTGIFVGSSLDYAGWLEDGTRKMAARPWLVPAMERNTDAVQKLIGSRIKDVVIKHGDV